VGAGAAEGAVDAASILKPSLARGQLQLIGATLLTITANMSKKMRHWNAVSSRYWLKNRRLKKRRRYYAVLKTDMKNTINWKSEMKH